MVKHASTVATWMLLLAAAPAGAQSHVGPVRLPEPPMARVSSPFVRQFGSDVMISGDQGSRNQFEPSIATDGEGGVFCLWKDGNSGSSHVLRSYSWDWGVTWSEPVHPQFNFEWQSDPVVHVDRYGTVHLVWLAYNSTANGNSGVSYARSYDGGVTFEPTRQIDDQGGELGEGFVDREWFWIDGDNVYLHYHADSEQYFRRSLDLGDTWKGGVYLGEAWISGPVVTGPDGTIYVIREGYRQGNASKIWLRKSTNGGVNWSPAVLVATSLGYDFEYRPASWALPTLAVDRLGYVYVGWTEGRGRFTGDTGGHFLVARSTDGGLTFPDIIEVNDDRSGTSSPVAFRAKIMPWLVVDRVGRLHAVWYDARSGYWEIMHSYSVDGGLNWADNLVVSDDHHLIGSDNYGDFLSADADEEYLYVTWSDKRDGKYRIYVDRTRLRWWPLEGELGRG
jgi:hypothetical protein